MLELAATQHDPSHQPPPKRRRPPSRQSIDEDDEEAMIMAEYASVCMEVPEEAEKYLRAQPTPKPRECECVMTCVSRMLAT